MRRNHTGHRVGEDHQNARLTDAQVRRMRKDYEREASRAGTGGGGGYGTMAKRYGCGESTARDIITYRTRASA